MADLLDRHALDVFPHERITISGGQVIERRMDETRELAAFVLLLRVVTRERRDGLEDRTHLRRIVCQGHVNRLARSSEPRGNLVPGEGAEPRKQGGLPSVGVQLGQRRDQCRLRNLFGRVLVATEAESGKPVETREVFRKEFLERLALTRVQPTREIQIAVWHLSVYRADLNGGSPLPPIVRGARQPESFAHERSCEGFFRARPSYRWMVRRHRFPTSSVLIMLLIGPPAWAQSVETPIALVANPGRTLAVALDRRITVKSPGQQVTGALVEPFYVYDRIVLPAGTPVVGHVAAIKNLPRGRAVLSGDFTRPRRVELKFDRVILSDGRSIPIEAPASDGVENVVLRTADAPKTEGVVAKARGTIVEEGKQRVAVFTAPGKAERLELALIRQLPYHPWLLARGTVYTARLTSPVGFGSVVPAPRAAEDAKPAPSSILRAHLVTDVSSAVSTSGTRVEAVLVEPVLDAQGNLILPEGTTLAGEVTVAKPARHLHRQGRLRLLFERVQAPDRASEPLLAALHSVESASSDRLRIDEEGGATSSSSNARFGAPALSALALVGTTHGRLDYDTDGAPPEMQYGGGGSSALGGFMGLGLAGIAMNALGHDVTLATTIYGLARTGISAIFGKGKDISFPSGTSIEVQLAPGPGQNARNETARESR